MSKFSAEVDQAYVNFIFAGKLFNPKKDSKRLKALKDATHPLEIKEIEEREKLEIHSRTYYATRESLLYAIDESMRSNSPPYDPRMISEGIDQAGLSAYDSRQMNFYIDLNINQYAQARLHLFYGGVDKPHGHGHGHAIVTLNPNGSVAAVASHRRSMELVA